MNENFSNQIGFFTAYKEIINDTFTLLVKKKDVLVRALIIPFILLLIIDYYEKSFSSFSNSENIFTSVSLLFFIILSLIISIIVAITVHRVLLMEENSVPKWGFFKFGVREFKYLGFSILIGLICIPALILVFIPIIGTVLALIMVFIIISRMSLVFPAIALNEQMSIFDSWNQTKDFKLITFFSIIIFPTIIAIFVGVVYMLVIKFLVSVVSVHFDILYVILNLFITVLVVATLSSTYKFVKKYTYIIEIEEENIDKIQLD